MSDPSSPGSLPRLGRYRLVRKLAEGGMGAVYAAVRDGAEGLCVLKLLKKEVSAEEVAARRFHREARIHALLDHPRIARVYGAGVEDGTFCLAMELVLGVDLAHAHSALRTEGRLLPPSMGIRWMLDVLEALDHAHGLCAADGEPLDVVHRDMTLRNVMVEFDGRAKLIDFGLVRGGVDDVHTRTGAFLGTPRFASPEQVMGQKIDRRTDLYSLSVALFEVLTGAPVVRPGKPVEVFRAVMQHDAPPAHTVNPALPPELSAVLARGMEKDRERRWPTAREYIAAIREASGSLATMDPEEIGAFVRERFRADVERVSELVTLGDQIASEWSGPPVDEPPVQTMSLTDEPLATTFVEFAPTRVTTQRVQLSPQILAALRPPPQPTRPSWRLLALATAATAIIASSVTYLAVSTRVEAPAPAVEVVPPPQAPEAPRAIGALPAPSARPLEPKVSPTAPPPRLRATPVPPASPVPSASAAPPPPLVVSAAPLPVDPRAALDAIERRAARLQSTLSGAAAEQAMRVRQRAFRALSSKRDDADLSETARALEQELAELER